MIDYILKARFLQRLKCHDMKLNFDNVMFDAQPLHTLCNNYKGTNCKSYIFAWEGGAKPTEMHSVIYYWY